MSEVGHASGEGGAREGALIAGRFRVEAVLGAGGMATVYRARDLATSRVVALKLLRAEAANDPEAVKRLRREGEVLTSLRHPSIVSIETFGAVDGQLFLAMELLEGETLGERMRRGRIEPGDLVPIVAGSVAGLEAAHDRGVIHRDLKPDNIFLCSGSAPEQAQIKLLDFGISKVYGSDRLTQTGEILGTPRYMAPEQLSAERDLDAGVDVYALGVILYEAIAGNPPFLGTTASDLIVSILHGKVAPLRSFRPDVPPDVEEVVMRAMARSRGARFASASDLGSAFADAAGAGDGRRAVRGGMRTNVLGSLTAESGGEASPRAAFSAGTFSAFAATPASAPATPVAMPADPVAPTKRSRFSAPGAPPSPDLSVHEPAASSPASYPRGVPKIEPAPRAVAAMRAVSGPTPGSGVVATGAASDVVGDDEVYALPTHRRRGLLVVGGLVAGALSAGLVVLALHLLSHPAHRATLASPPPRTAAQAPRSGAPGDEPSAELQAPSGAPSPPPSMPAGATSGAPPSSPPTAEHDRRRPRRRSRAPHAGAPGGAAPRPPATAAEAEVARVLADGARIGPVPDVEAIPVDPSAAAGPDAPATPPPAGAVSQNAPSQGASGADLLRQARAAEARSDPRACVTLAQRALEAGGAPPSILLELEGDCQLRSGDRDGALKTYERFCRLFGDNPASGEVRGVVESLGGHCD